MKKNNHKKKFKKQFKGQQTDTGIQEGMTGFLITCDKNRSREAIKESYQLIERYVEQLYPEEAQRYEKILEQNIEKLNQQRPQFNKMLYNFDTKVNCVLFIRINHQEFPGIDVDEISKATLYDVHLKQTPISRYCYKLIPIKYVCRATLDELECHAKPLIEKYFPLDRPRSWLLHFKSRYSSKINQKDVLQLLNKLIEPLHYSDFKEPEFTFYVEVNGAIMYLNVLPKYLEYNHYAIKKGKDLRDDVPESDGLQQKVLKKVKQNNEQVEQIKVSEVSDFQREQFHEEQEVDLF